ncbi:MAG: hypothetical protein CL678_08370 [Bdellovibrionaceae bacterium]|nr:hypothetical protein [Pseudobdellovibrionaceae bacterium]
MLAALYREEKNKGGGSLNTLRLSIFIFFISSVSYSNSLKEFRCKILFTQLGSHSHLNKKWFTFTKEEIPLSPLINKFIKQLKTNINYTAETEILKNYIEIIHDIKDSSHIEPLSLYIWFDSNYKALLTYSKKLKRSNNDQLQTEFKKFLLSNLTELQEADRLGSSLKAGEILILAEDQVSLHRQKVSYKKFKKKFQRTSHDILVADKKTRKIKKRIDVKRKLSVRYKNYNSIINNLYKADKTKDGTHHKPGINNATIYINIDNHIKLYEKVSNELLSDYLNNEDWLSQARNSNTEKNTVKLFRATFYLDEIILINSKNNDLVAHLLKNDQGVWQSQISFF